MNEVRCSTASSAVPNNFLVAHGRGCEMTLALQLLTADVVPAPLAAVLETDRVTRALELKSHLSMSNLRTDGTQVMAPWIELENLTKQYGEFTALSALSLGVAQGEVHGFLGPNGAGKTTTLRILMGALVPTSGTARIRGLDCVKNRVELKRQVGYLPDVPVFYDYLKGWELLRFVGQMHGLRDDVLAARAQMLLGELELLDAASDFVANYSLGMKKKLGLALALIHDPEILILDEPTTGLDPLAMRQVQALIRSYADSGRTVFLSTHLLDMAERLCHRVAIIHRGRLLAQGEPSALRERQGSSAQDPTLEEVFLSLTAGQR